MTASLDSERLAVLVHEVRSPVAALSAIAEALAEGTRDGEARRSLIKLVALACRGIERIVADASVVSIRLEPVDVSEVVSDVVAATRLRGVAVELKVDEGIPLVDADPSRLGQILDNLVVNAVVHGAEPVFVRVTKQATVLIEVSDAGRGIPRGELDRIFEPRVRLDPESAEGSGLGLALSRAIAEGHGGSLTVTSPPGRGATFVVSLPPRTD